MSEAKAPLLRPRVDWLEVASLPPDPLGGAIQRWRDVEELDETHRGMLVSPAGLTRFVAVAVPPQVEPGARADLQDAQRPSGSISDLEESSEQSGATTHLVGLASARYQPPDLRAVLRQCVP